jgi:hypothetical protein
MSTSDRFVNPYEVGLAERRSSSGCSARSEARTQGVPIAIAGSIPLLHVGLALG